MKKFSIKIKDQPLEFSAVKRGDELTIFIDNREWTAVVQAVNGQEAVLIVDGRKVVLKLHKNGQQRQLWVNGRTLTYSILRETGTGPAEGGGSLAAEIPAVVSQVLVEVGQAVSAGEKLVLLESMKMVIPLVAPVAGTVTAVYCSVGEAVQPGVKLVEIH